MQKYNNNGNVGDWVTDGHHDTIAQYAPLELIRIGDRELDGSLYGQTRAGYYWSSRQNSRTHAYLLGIYRAYIISFNFSNSRGLGFSVRCLTR